MLAWHADELEQRLGPWLPGARVEVLPQCDSTNTTLLERARQSDGPFAPCLLVAEQQTAGRGRLGRTWVSEAGASLTFSLALPLAPKDWSGLSLVVGLAVAEALDPADERVGSRTGERGEGGEGGKGGERGERRPRPRIALKWPNDLWLTPAQPPRDTGDGQGRKLGGILVETVARGAQRIAIIGIGLNVRPLAPARAANLGRDVACCQELDPGFTAPAALARVAPALAPALRGFEAAGFAAFAARYALRDVLRGQAVATSDPRAAAGVAEGVGADGALLVRSEGVLHRIASGEVSVQQLGAAAPDRSSGSPVPARPEAPADAVPEGRGGLRRSGGP